MAVFWTDFSEKDNGSLKGQGWTERWMDYDYTVVEDVGSTGGKHVEMRDNAQFAAGTSLISWDDIDADPNRGNSETLIRFRQNTGGNNIFFALSRGANAYASRSGYMGTSQVDNDYVSIERFVSGTYGLVNNVTGITIDRDVWNWIRFRVNEGNLQAKIWPDGDPEPESFQNITTDGNVTAAGWVGFGVYGGGGSNVDIDVFSVATDGDSATMEKPKAQFFTNFSEYTTGQFPSDWTGSSVQDGTVEEDVSLEGGKGFYIDGNISQFNSNSWNLPGSTLTDFEVVTSLKIETTATDEIDGWIVLRGTDENNFFRIQLRNKNLLEFAKVISGTNTLGNSVTFNHTAGDLIHIRADVTQSGSNVDLRAKAWLNDDTEPDWMVSQTYTEISQGYTGVGRRQIGSTIYDIFGVGIGGEPAPMIEPIVDRYDEFTIPNPTSDLSNVVVGFDLANNMSANWWSEVDTADGTKLRAYKEDGTELAFDIIGFDNVAQQGILWARWSGDITSVGTQKIRISPPKATKTSYESGGAFGRHATWIDYEHVWTLNEDPTGTAPQFIDRAGGDHMVTAGTPSSVPGLLGNAVEFASGSGEYLEPDNLTGPTATDDLTFSIWTNISAKPEFMVAMGEHGGNMSLTYRNDADVFYGWIDASNYTGQVLHQTSPQIGEWNKVTFKLTPTEFNILMNGVPGNSPVANVGTLNAAAKDEWVISVRTRPADRNWNGQLQYGTVRNFGISDDHDVYEYNNQEDMATFWGVGTWIDPETPQPQTYSTNFSEYTSDQAPTGWTKRWQDMDFIVRDEPEALGGKVLKAEPNVNSVNNTIHGISWDDVDADPLRDDVDVVMRFRYTLESGQQSAWTMGRGQGTLFAEKEAYGSSHYENLEYEIIGKWVNGAAWDEIVVQTGITQNINTWYYKRFRIEGNTLKSRLWESGNTEPGTWTIETTDNEISGSGWVGLGVDEDPAGLEVDYFSVATGGDISPLALEPNEISGSISTGGNLSGVIEQPLVESNEIFGTISGTGTLSGVLEQPVIEINEITGTLSGNGILNGTILQPTIDVNELIGTLSGNGTLSGTIEQPEIYRPQLVAPISGAVGVSTTPVVEWDQLDTNEIYRLQISTTDDFISPIIDVIVRNVTYQLSEPLSALTTYFWRVRAYTGVNEFDSNNLISNWDSNNNEIEVVSDTTPPTISSGSLTTSNITNSGFNVNFTKATDTYPQSELIYELYSGDQTELSSLVTIKNQTLEDFGTDVSQLTISNANQGTLYYFNVLVRDPSGNEAIYTGSNDITLDPEVISIEVEADGEDVSSGIQLNLDQTLQLSITVAVSDSDNNNYSTSIVNTNITTIDGNDIITGESEGTTTLIITADLDGTQIEVPIEVIEDELANDSEIVGITTI